MSGRWRLSKRPRAEADAHARVPPLLPLSTSRKGLSNAVSCWYCDCKITSFNEPIFHFGRRHARFLFRFSLSLVVFLSVEYLIFVFTVCSSGSSSFFLLLTRLMQNCLFIYFTFMWIVAGFWERGFRSGLVFLLLLLLLLPRYQLTLYILLFTIIFSNFLLALLFQFVFVFVLIDFWGELKSSRSRLSVSKTSDEFETPKEIEMAGL